MVVEPSSGTASRSGARGKRLEQLSEVNTYLKDHTQQIPGICGQIGERADALSSHFCYVPLFAEFLTKMSESGGPK
jgi:hypothetical protein